MAKKSSGKAKAIKGTTALVKTGEPQIDLKLIDEAVTYINHKVEKTIEIGSQGLLDIGNYVLTKFFDDDPENVQFKGRQKESSFRKLADHPGLQMSKSGLHNSVRLAIQEKLLLGGGGAPSGVSISHRVAILQVADIKTKKRLLEEVTEKKLTVRQLQDRVAQATGKLLPGEVPPTSAEGGERKTAVIPRPLTTFLKLDMARLANVERLSKLRKPTLSRYRKTLEDAADRIKQLIKVIDQAAK